MGEIPNEYKLAPSQTGTEPNGRPSVGLFTNENVEIAKDELIGEFRGKIISSAEALNRNPKYITVNKDVHNNVVSVIDASDPSEASFLRYITMASSPQQANTKFYQYGDHVSLVFATKHIPAETELLYYPVDDHNHDDHDENHKSEESLTAEEIATLTPKEQKEVLAARRLSPLGSIPDRFYLADSQTLRDPSGNPVRGLFTKHKIKAGKLIGEYRGVRISAHTAEIMSKNSQYLFAVRDKRKKHIFVIDAHDATRSSFPRYVNAPGKAREANAKFWQYGECAILLWAEKDIPAEHEIFAWYGAHTRAVIASH